MATRDPQGNAFELTLGVGHSVDLVLKDDLVTDEADEAQVADARLREATGITPCGGGLFSKTHRPLSGGCRRRRP